MKTEKDALVVVLSDMHSGSTKALFPNRFWQFQHTNHTPTDDQKAMWGHFETCAKGIQQARKGKRLIVVHDGDAIEGVHNGSPQIVTRLKEEQVQIHVDLMDYFLRTVGFDRGDRLYYTIGTETHTDDNEECCAADLDAEETPDGRHVFNALEMQVNGRALWFTHHGPYAGRGANKGNSLRNWLRDIFWESLEASKQPPDMVVTGHTHDPFYNTYVQNYRGSYHTVHGIICPSWQLKTRFAYKVAPIAKNKIGLASFVVHGDGEIRPPVMTLLELEESKVKA